MFQHCTLQHLSSQYGARDPKHFQHQVFVPAFAAFSVVYALTMFFAASRATLKEPEPLQGRVQADVSCLMPDESCCWDAAAPMPVVAS